LMLGCCAGVYMSGIEEDVQVAWLRSGDAFTDV